MSWLSKAVKKAKKKLKKVNLKNVAGKIAGDLKKASKQIAKIPVVGTLASPIVGALSSAGSQLDSVQKAINSTNLVTKNISGGLANVLQSDKESVKHGIDSGFIVALTPPGFNPPARVGFLTRILGTSKKRRI